MTTEQRQEIVSLMRKAGMADLRISEVANGCRTDRVRQILVGQTDGQAGTLTLSDPDAGAQALRIAYEAD